LAAEIDVCESAASADPTEEVRKARQDHGIDPVVFDLGIPAIGLTGQTERYASLSRLDQMLTIAR
jgi:hypothetical protein